MTIRALLLCCVFWGAATCSAQTPIKVDFAMDSDPLVVDPGTKRVISPAYFKVWREFLEQPSEQDMLRRTAGAIERARGFDVPGLEEFIAPLTKVLTAPNSSPSVRFAVARTLIALQAKEAAPALLETAQRTGSDLRQLVEPALADWNFAPAREQWTARLTARDVRHRDLLLAIRCLGRVRDAAVAARLRELLHDQLRPHDLRLDAAQALGQILSEGLEADAEKLMREPQPTADSITRRLCAVRLLQRHQSETTRSRLIAMASDREAAVAAAAMRRLVEIDPELLLPFVQAALRHDDAQIRRAAFSACNLRPTVERIEWIGVLLDDVNPNLRGDVRDALFEQAKKPELAAVVRTTAMQQLAGESWRGHEQAALLLGTLDHEPAAPRLVELLKSTRPEVMISSAWSLRKLAVEETLAPMLAHAQEIVSNWENYSFRDGADPQVGQLCEAFGLMNYRAADELLRRCIPKGTAGEMTRSSAVWSLGKWNKAHFDEALAAKLIERLLDASPINPELPRVRAAAAISLARMDAPAHMTTIEKKLGGTVATDTAKGIEWAVVRLSGKDLPPVEPTPIGFGFSFAEPAFPSSKK